MTRAQSITIEQVAETAGVSPGTVSRVLNGKNKENRPAIAKRSERIRQIALQLGYRPNAAARSVLRGRFCAVAFVTCGDLGTDWYPISGLNGIHATLDPLEWRLVFNELPASKINDPQLVPQLFRETAVDGLIVNLLPAFPEKMVEYFEAQPLPCVWLNLKRRLRAVYPDEMGGAAMGVHWLIERGYKRIGFFSRHFTPPGHFSASDRFNGFEAAMAAAGLPAHRRFHPLEGDRMAGGSLLQHAEQFLQSYPDVQAVVCYEYEEAVCLTMAGERAGRRFPDDLQIIGFHEREIRANSGLSIPTLIVPFQQIGRQCVEMLLQIIDSGNRDVESVRVGFEKILI